MIKVLFICLGNICRSPTAEGVFRKLVEHSGFAEHIRIDSAGTHAYHVGQAPDRRAQQTALQRGIDLSRLRGRQVTIRDAEAFDYVLAMDQENYDNLLMIFPKKHHHKVMLYMGFATDRHEKEVPDPYFGGANGFDRVLDMIEEAATGLLDEIKLQHSL